MKLSKLTRLYVTAVKASESESPSIIDTSWKEEVIRNATPYCLGCEKEGHRTNECHATSGFNTPRDIEITRLAWIANDKVKT